MDVKCLWQLLMKLWHLILITCWGTSLSNARFSHCHMQMRVLLWHLLGHERWHPACQNLIPNFFLLWIPLAPCGLRVEKIDPLHFLTRCHKRQLNQALFVLCLRLGFWVCIVLLFIRATFCVMLVCVVLPLGCCWLSCQYLPNDWLERLLWGSLFMVRRLSSRSPGRRALITFSVFVNCFIVHLCCAWLYTIYFLLLWHDIACLCWKCH